MTDMRRTILWVVFTMSLVLLWDAWNKNVGKPSLFSPAPPAAGASAPGTVAQGASAVPAPIATASEAAAPGRFRPPVSAASAREM
jgi:YidC/Oxa1 family membrane protein insertase